MIIKFESKKFIEYVNGGIFPRYIYKYQRIDPATSLSGLKENYLWFSKYEDFNDPFDCKIALRDNYNPSEIRNFLSKFKWGESVSLDNMVSHYANNPSQLCCLMVNSINQYLTESVRICCFTKNPKNLLMWSHYADSHRGMVLEFDVLQDIDVFEKMTTMYYRKDFPIENWMNGNFLISLIASKALCWKYEEELRLIKINFQNNKVNFKKNALRSVIFGCKTNKAEMKLVQDSLNNYSNISFKKCIQHPKKYELIIQDIIQ